MSKDDDPFDLLRQISQVARGTKSKTTPKAAAVGSQLSEPISEAARERGRRTIRVLQGIFVLIIFACLVTFLTIGPHWYSPKQLLAFGAEGTEPGQLYHPSYIGLDGHGNIYVADWDDGRINVFDPTGKFLRLISVDHPTNFLGMAVAPDETVYVSYDGVIHRLDTKGNDSTLSYADARGDLLGDISGIALGADGSLAAADNNGDVLFFETDGTAKRLLAQAYNLPSFSSRNWLDSGASILSYDVSANSADTNISVAVDGSGNIYALGWISAAVLKTDAEGTPLSKFGSPASFPGGWQRGRFDFPEALGVDSYGRIYIGDSSGVQVFGADQKYLFSIPLGGGVDALALDSQNNLYVVTYPPQVIKLAAQKP